MIRHSKNPGPRARDVMTREPVTVRASASVTDAAGLLAQHRIGVLPVVDEAGVLIGALSAGDIVRLRAHAAPAEDTGEELLPTADVPREVAAYWFHQGEAEARRRWWDHGMPEGERTIEGLFSPQPLSVAEDASLLAVGEMMRRHRVHHVIVVDVRRHPVGVVSALDLVP
jgi:CBS domain-containing protein